MKAITRLLILGVLLACASVTTPARQDDRLPTNIFEIMGIRGETWATAQAGIARGEKWRRFGYANRYLFIDSAHSWPYDVTADDRAASDWHRYED